jgi:hypothetical protein
MVQRDIQDKPDPRNRKKNWQSSNKVEKIFRLTSSPFGREQ